MSVLDTMKAASAARRQVTLCLDGALQAQHDERMGALVQAGFADKGNAGKATLEVADEMDEIRTRMAAAEVTFTFERLPWARRLALQAEHPPRDDNTRDGMEGANTETYMPALIKESCVSAKGADGIPVTDIPDDAWQAMFDQLQLGQFETLFGAAKNANDLAVTVPISARGFLTTRDSAASLKSPAPGKHPLGVSTDGNPRTRRKSSTKKTAPSAT